MGSPRDTSPSAASQPLMGKYQLEADVRPIQTVSTASARSYVRVSLSAVISVALIIAVGVGLSPDSGPLSAGAEINRIVPQFQPQIVEFDFQSTDEYIPGPNDTDVPDAIWEKWTAMLPVGNGVLNIPEYAEYPHLTEPIAPMTEQRQGLSMFSTAWVHQLHCLFFVMKEYHRILHHGPDGTEYYIDPTHNSYHASHCFNYLRQAILCNLDSTLEGSGRGSGAPDGSGQTHVCRNHAQAVEWLESHKFDMTHTIDNI